MKGNNTLELNAATMIEAMQLWCDHTFKNPPKVTAVKQSSGRAGYADVFEVSVEEPKDSGVAAFVEELRNAPT